MSASSFAESTTTAVVSARPVQDIGLLSRIDAAFGTAPRPEHFTNYQHCEECAEHDRLLRTRDRQTLSLADVGNPGWDPLCFITPEGLAYYFPTLARLALAEPDALYGWYADQFLFHLYWGYRDNAFLQFCTPEQRATVAALLAWLIEQRAALIDADGSVDEWLRCWALWAEAA